jgi:hypothetical protein
VKSAFVQPGQVSYLVRRGQVPRVSSSAPILSLAPAASRHVCPTAAAVVLGEGAVLPVDGYIDSC